MNSLSDMIDFVIIRMNKLSHLDNGTINLRDFHHTKQGKIWKVNIKIFIIPIMQQLMDLRQVVRVSFLVV